MEEGRKYKVVYFDGRIDKAKDFIFKGKDSPFLNFVNTVSGKEEQIHQDKVIRTEEIKDEPRGNAH